jgi:transcription antitermination factor NusG
MAQLDLEVFLPQVRQEKSVCGVRRMLIRPLFTGYLFAHFCPAQIMGVVRYARGVLRIVGTERFPIPLEEAVIDSLRDRVGEDGYVRLEVERFGVGEKVIIKDGPFAGWAGRIAREQDEGRRVLILLDLLQQVRMWIDPRALTRAQAAV